MACKDCKHCDKKGLLILPLRYSAVVADKSAALSSLPTLPSKLGKGVTDIALSAHAKYGARIMREGFIYVLIEREGIKSWEGYLVMESAQLYSFPVDTPPQVKPEPFCNRDGTSMHAYMVAVRNAQDVPNAWFLFTPTAMTKAKLDEYKADPDGMVAAGKMQHFSPAQWVAGGTSQTHTLLSMELQKNVVEYVLYNQHGGALSSELGKTMRAQLFPAHGMAYAGTPPDAQGNYNGTLGGIYNNLKRNGGAVLVLYDHIGITQELNNFRNDALTPVEDFLAASKNGISNQRRLEAMQAIADVKAAFVSNAAALAKRSYAEEMQRPSSVSSRLRHTARRLREDGREEEATQLDAEIERHEATRKKNLEAIYEPLVEGKAASDKWTRKYETQLDMSELNGFREQLTSISDAAGKLAESRADDHIAWLNADRLVDAFDTYDRNDLGSGFCFTQEHGLCTFGMFGIQKNKVYLAQWVGVTKVARKNLYMRSILYNHKILEEEASKAFEQAGQQVAAAGSLSAVGGAPWLKAAKGLIDVLKKTDSAWDEWLRDKDIRKIHKGELAADPAKKIVHNFSKFHRSAEGRAYAFISELAQALSNKTGKTDHLISGVVGMLLYSKLGKLAEVIAFEELMLRISDKKLADGYKGRSAERNREMAERHVSRKAARVPGQLEESIEVLIQDEQRKVRDKVRLTLDQLDEGVRPETNNFRQARMCVLLMTIEGVALATKIRDPNSSTRLKAELTASVLSLASMGFDLLYAVVKSIREIEPYAKAPGIDTAADVMRGGLKLTAGLLSAVAGGISAVLDFDSGVDELEKRRKNWVLVGIYFSRGTLGMVNMVLGWIAAYSYCVPLLMRMTQKALIYESVFFGRLVSYMVGATILAESAMVARTVWLIRLARFNLAGLVITVAEIVYRCWIMDDDLENWCQSCCFRKDKRNSVFNEKLYPDSKTEMQELQKAYKAIAV